MSRVEPLSEAIITSLAQVLGECGTGSDITRVLKDRGLVDNSGESTKWRRLYWVFMRTQREGGSADRVLGFVKAYMAPARFVGRSEAFEEQRADLNAVLILAGLQLGADGKLRRTEPAKTLDEAERRVRTIESKFKGRRIHSEVIKYCRADLMRDDYFDAVFEASKGLAQRIREMSGVHLDGAALVDAVFAIDRPVLALNSLQTETERSEHKGFAALLKGCFGAIRNPLAHEPKILWDGEDDAADYFSLISLLHRRLDSCVPTQPPGAGS